MDEVQWKGGGEKEGEVDGKKGRRGRGRGGEGGEPSLSVTKTAISTSFQFLIKRQLP